MGDNNQLNRPRPPHDPPEPSQQTINTTIAPTISRDHNETGTTPPAPHTPTIDIRGSIPNMTPTTTGVT